MRKTLLATSLLIGFISSNVHADVMYADPSSGFDYNYVDARIGVSPLTFGAAASVSIHPNAHAYVSWDSEFDSDYSFAAGLGFHAPMTNWADLTGDILYRLVDDRAAFNDDSGIDLSLGWRQWVAPQVEVAAKAGYYSINNTANTDEFYASLTGRFYATEQFSLAAEGTLNGIYGEQLMLSARFKY